VAAELYGISVAAGLRRCKRPEGRPGRWPACCGRGALPGRGAVRRPPPRPVRGGRAAQARDHACRPGRRH